MPARRSLTVLLALLGALALVVLAGCGGSDDDDGGGNDTAQATQEQAATTATESSGPCELAEAPAAKTDARARKPKGRLDAGKSWTATVTTNCGSFTIALDTAQAPKTAASFASLARAGFYDDLTFHRIAPGFVIQGGDPLGDGTGGPGYSVVEKPPRDLQYTHGVVAMAKTATEPHGASGSQFFVVTGEDVGLPPQYALVGRVVEGLDIVDAIGALPLDSADPQGSTPVDPVVIESVEIAGR